QAPLGQEPAGTEERSQEGTEGEEAARGVGDLGQHPDPREAAQRQRAQKHPGDVAEPLDDLLGLHAPSVRATERAGSDAEGSEPKAARAQAAPRSSAVAS